MPGPLGYEYATKERLLPKANTVDPFPFLLCPPSVLRLHAPRLPRLGQGNVVVGYLLSLLPLMFEYVGEVGFLLLSLPPYCLDFANRPVRQK